MTNRIRRRQRRQNTLAGTSLICGAFALVGMFALAFALSDPVLSKMTEAEQVATVASCFALIVLGILGSILSLIFAFDEGGAR